MVILEENDSRRFAAIEQSAEELRWDVGKLKNTTERLETSNNELVSKVTGLEQRLDSQSQLLATISETLRRLDPSNREARQADKAIATSSNSPNQGTDNFLVLPGSEQHIGYRNIAEALANQDSIMREVDMPVFNGSSPFGWIARVERIFRLGEYSDNQKLDLVSVSLEGPGLIWFNEEMEHEYFRDWADFKQRMLDRFAGSWYAESGKRLCCIQKTGSIKDYVTEFAELSSQVKGKGDYEKVSEPEVHEPGKHVHFAETIDIETAPEISPVTALICSSPKVLLQHISNPEVVQEASSNGAKELIDTSLIYMKESLKNETVPVMEHEEDTNVIPVSHVQELDELSLDLVSKKESVLAIVRAQDWVHQVDSPTVEEFPETYGACDSVMMPDGPVVFKGVPMCFLFVEEAIGVFQSLSGIHVHWCVLYEHEEILSTTKKLKCCKSWHFKYKTKLPGRNSVATMQFVFSRRLVVRTDYKAEIYVLRMRLIGQSLKSSTLTDVEFQVKHKWRNKLLQQFLELEMNLDCVVILFADATCWLYVDKGWTFTLSSVFSCWEQLRDEVKWVQFRTENKSRQAFLVNIFGDESIDEAATRLEKLQQWLLQSSLPQLHHRLKKQKFLKAWHFKYKLHGISNLIMLQLQGSLQRVAHTMQKVYLAHKARTLQAISGLPLRHLVGSTEVAATENSSEPSALVQKFAARLLWLLLIGINIEIDIKTGILAVLAQIIQHHNALLILKSNLLQIQVHKRLKQRKFTKTWMFKYKERRGHVGFLFFSHA